MYHVQKLEVTIKCLETGFSLKRSVVKLVLNWTNLDWGVQRIQFILNWVNVYFVNLLQKALRCFGQFDEL